MLDIAFCPFCPLFCPSFIGDLCCCTCQFTFKQFQEQFH